MKLAPASDAAVLCAITVTGVAISEEERVKTSACPLFHSYTHAQTHTFFPPPLSLAQCHIHSAQFLAFKPDLQH